MQSTAPICLLCLLVLQLIFNVASLVSLAQNPDIGLIRPRMARRLRAPLMGRSVLSAENGDEVDLIRNDGFNSNENDSITLSKRRYGVVFFDPRKYIKSKSRGPLFG